MTAKNSTEDRIKCYNAGANAYISKPFELKVLEARINNFLAEKKNKQEEFRSDIDTNFDLLDASAIDKEFMEKVIDIAQENLSSSSFDVVQLADILAMSKSSLYRKIKAITGLSPVEFIRNIRLKQGMNMLKNKSVTVSEVAYAVSYTHLRAHETRHDLVCRLLLEKKKKNNTKQDMLV